MATGRIGTTPVLTVRWSKAPAAGTTSLSGLDDNSVSLVYSVGYEQVYRNGTLLSRGNDYTATNGTSITLIDATLAGDIVEVIANATIALTDTYTQSQANGKFINNTLTTTTGDIIYASAANTPARLGIGSTDQVLKVSGGIPAWGSTPVSTLAGCLVRNSADISVSNATVTTLNFDTEVFDTDGFHSTSTNTSRLTVPSGKAGYYWIWNQIAIATNSTGRRFSTIYKNGATTLFQNEPQANSNFYTMPVCGTVAYLAVGDYVEAQAYQASGGSLNVKTDLALTQFGFYFLGA